MQLVIFSHPQHVKGEEKIIDWLVEMGLDRFHIRKPSWKRDEVEKLLQNLSPQTYPFIALHDHHELMEEYGLGGVHLPERKRKAYTLKQLEIWKEQGIRLSSSVHSKEELKRITFPFDYLFVSPVFSSISKQNYPANPIWQKRIPSQWPLYALGGIDETKVEKVADWGYEGIGVLGRIWKNVDTVEKHFALLKEACTKNSNTYHKPLNA